MLKKVSQKIEQIKKKYELDLLRQANVVGVGIGMKMKKGISTNKVCLKVYVCQKLPKSKLDKNEILPEKLEGIETDIEEIGKLEAQ